MLYPDDFLNKIIHGDCLEVMKDIPDNSIDLIITDPPYAKEFNYLWEPLAIHSSRILKDGGNLVTLCGHYQIPFILNAFNGYLRYWWIFWMRQNKINTLCGKWVSIKGKPALWFLKGKRRKIDGKHIPWDSIDGKNGVDFAEAKKIYKWGQSIGWFHHYIETMTIENDVVLDPFLGSGSSLIAAAKLKRNFIGIEKESKYVEIAKERIASLA